MRLKKQSEANAAANIEQAWQKASEDIWTLDADVDGGASKKVRAQVSRAQSRKDTARAQRLASEQHARREMQELRLLEQHQSAWLEARSPTHGGAAS